MNHMEQGKKTKTLPSNLKGSQNISSWPSESYQLFPTSFTRKNAWDISQPLPGRKAVFLTRPLPLPVG